MVREVYISQKNNKTEDGTKINKKGNVTYQGMNIVGGKNKGKRGGEREQCRFGPVCTRVNLPRFHAVSL